MPCPDGAVCPGGFRLWPKVGHWIEGNVEEAARKAWHNPPAIDKCAFPAAARCAGYSPARQASACGEGYAGDRCGDCVGGYYQDGDGFCLACPENSLAAVAASGLLIALALLGVFVAVLCLSAGCAYREKRRADATSGDR